MTKHKALYPEMTLSRKEGGRELASIEYSVDVLIQRLEDYIKI